MLHNVHVDAADGERVLFAARNGSNGDNGAAALAAASSAVTLPDNNGNVARPTTTAASSPSCTDVQQQQQRVVTAIAQHGDDDDDDESNDVVVVATAAAAAAASDRARRGRRTRSRGDDRHRRHRYAKDDSSSKSESDVTAAAAAVAAPPPPPGSVRVVVVREGGRTTEELLDAYELARLSACKQAALQRIQRKLDVVAVPNWVQLHPLLGAYLAEGFGTFAWTLALSLTSVRNQSIFDAADDTNMTSVPIGFMFTCMVFTFAYISGGHFNPAVSIAVFLIRRLDFGRCVAYLLCQLLAALLAGLVALLLQQQQQGAAGGGDGGGGGVDGAGGTHGIFVPSVANSYVSSGIFAELIYTFAVSMVVLHVGYSRQSGRFFYGFAIGMTMAAGSASVGRISGGAFNPAAATGLQLALCLAGECDNLKSFWVYWLAPVAGAALAALLFAQMMQPEHTPVLHDEKTTVATLQPRAADVAMVSPLSSLSAAHSDSSSSSRSSSSSSSVDEREGATRRRRERHDSGNDNDAERSKGGTAVQRADDVVELLDKSHTRRT